MRASDNMDMWLDMLDHMNNENWDKAVSICHEFFGGQEKKFKDDSKIKRNIYELVDGEKVFYRSIEHIRETTGVSIWFVVQSIDNGVKTPCGRQFFRIKKEEK